MPLQIIDQGALNTNACQTFEFFNIDKMMIIFPFNIMHYFALVYHIKVKHNAVGLVKSRAKDT